MRYTTHRYNIFMKTPPTAARCCCRRRLRHVRVQVTRGISRPFSIYWENVHTWVMWVWYGGTVIVVVLILQWERSTYANFYFDFAKRVFGQIESNFKREECPKMFSLLQKKIKRRSNRYVHSVHYAHTTKERDLTKCGAHCKHTNTNTVCTYSTQRTHIVYFLIFFPPALFLCSSSICLSFPLYISSVLSLFFSPVHFLFAAP